MFIYAFYIEIYFWIALNILKYIFLNGVVSQRKKMLEIQLTMVFKHLKVDFHLMIWQPKMRLPAKNETASQFDWLAAYLIDF